VSFSVAVADQSPDPLQIQADLAGIRVEALRARPGTAIVVMDGEADTWLQLRSKRCRAALATALQNEFFGSLLGIRFSTKVTGPSPPLVTGVAGILKSLSTMPQ
jgi:hypothetical protein